MLQLHKFPYHIFRHRPQFSKILTFSHLVLVLSLFSVLLNGCSKDTPTPPPPPTPDSFETVILVYAASANNLYSNLLADKSEMLLGLKQTDPQKVRLFLLETTPTTSSKGRSVILYEALRDYPDETYSFSVVKKYDETVFSTDPKRLTEVISDVKELRKANNYGLIFWSHGGGLDPDFSNHVMPEVKKISLPSPSTYDPGMNYWWGVDEVNGVSDKMDIHELADAIPDNAFEFIWFDCCYMGGIELAYQLRNKTRYFIGYPTEVYSPGLNYTNAIPYLLVPNPDLVAAAKSLYDFYTYEWSTTSASVTVGVFDLSKIKDVADAVRQCYLSYSKPSVQGLINYSRRGVSSFYDFRQTVRRIASESGISIPGDLDTSLKEFTVCKFASQYTFSGQYIPAGEYSGISTHIYDPASVSAIENYYRTLDWYNDVYPQN